ncbi:single-stranded-DNA-specific exonuclease RecJ [Candidatus Nomurabacteria bacterium]|nr:single-stranded-DNA-specific exonuclease RecJ [Candidatus Nomurabacteria bacterium]USN94744.1 MAG: single-stranded-DNA-specific exonuclease RecJ [Candidatus Nomurabacteria bacterium]
MSLDFIKDLLKKRGIVNKTEIEKFLNPSYEDRHDPFLMKDMKKAVERIKKAIDKDEKITIYSDYDCDGIPGAVVFSDFLEKIGFSNFEVYIPDRHDEGYGLNMSAVESILKNGTKLLVTIDLGITAIEEALLLKEKGVDLIITDHHEPKEVLPECFAILNPKTDDYPEKMLCGSGVCYKFVEGFLSKYGTEYSVPNGWEKWLLDMVSLATLSDMVPLLGENRVFAKYGLLVFRKTKRPGLNALLSELSIDKRFISEDDITFMITPRINAASRLDDPMIAFRLLSTKDAKEAMLLAKKLSEINDTRKKLVAQTVKEAKKRLAKRETGKVIVIGDPTWRPGILGLVASKISEEYGKSTFVWGEDGGGEIKGSCRSFGDEDVFTLMDKTKDSFVSFGGHKGAGGFSVSKDKIHFLEEELSKNSKRGENETGEVESIFDTTLSLIDVSRESAEMLRKMSPFGFGNPKPIIKFEELNLKNLRKFGKDKSHLELIVSDKSGGQDRKVIYFFAKDDDVAALEEIDIFSLKAHIDESYYGGSYELRLRYVSID